MIRVAFRDPQLKGSGHEFQAKLHWHLHDIGIKHVYIKPASPHLNGKVERSHSTDEQEFYQLLSYTVDVEFKKKLAVWEDFYNLWRPHSSKNGKTPYDVLNEEIKNAACFKNLSRDYHRAHIGRTRI